MHDAMKKKVLSFGAHPDDIEIGCGGTEVLLAKKGFDVYHVIATSGESGSMTIPKSELARIREDEAQKSAEMIGARILAFLEYPDGGLTSFTRDMKIELINLIRSLRPNIVFIHASNDEATDHRVVHGWVMSALKSAGGPWFQESEGDPWLPESVFGYEVWNPLEKYQRAVDISASIETKINALRCHQSQVITSAYDEAFKGLARFRGVMSGAGDYAEVFEVIRISAF